MFRCGVCALYVFGFPCVATTTATKAETPFNSLAPLEIPRQRRPIAPPPLIRTSHVSSTLICHAFLHPELDTYLASSYLSPFPPSDTWESYRERAQLLTVIKLQHKQLTLSLSGGTSKTSEVTPSSTSIGTAAARATTTNYARATTRTATTPQLTQIPPPRSRTPPTSPPLTPTALSFADDDDIIVTGEDWGAAGSAAGTTNICTSNEDAYSTGPEEEECFPFSSSERTQLLCKVEMQREEAARARSCGSGSCSNHGGSAAASISAAAGQSTAGVSGRRRGGSGGCGGGGNLRVTQRKDGAVRSEGQRAQAGVQTRLGGEDATAASATPASSSVGNGEVRSARALPRTAGMEDRLEVRSAGVLGGVSRYDMVCLCSCVSALSKLGCVFFLCFFFVVHS